MFKKLINLENALKQGVFLLSEPSFFQRKTSFYDRFTKKK